MNDISGINLDPGRRAMPRATSQPRSSDAVRREQDSFNRVMGNSTGWSGKATPAERAREAAEQLVAITFVRPILEEMRQSNSAAAPFAPSSGEKQFRSFLDAKLADEITRSAQFPLVDRITRDLVKAAERAASAASKPEEALK